MRERNKERTAGRKKAKDLLAVLFFFLMLPYTCSLLSGIQDPKAVETAGKVGKEEEKAMVSFLQENGVRRMPLDEFLVGALAACIPADYGDETLKAQAVILRSIVAAKMTEGEPFFEGESGLSYLDENAREKLWKDAYEENEERFRRLVEKTAGIVLEKDGTVVSPPFFRLSAGSTREGANILPAESAAFCRSVACPHDVEAKDFLQEKEYDRDAFCRRLEEEGFPLPAQGARIVLTRDSAGYVLSVGCDGCYMEGEKFRKLFELPSACFYMREQEGRILLQTKGIGHGIGFDQYGADLLAEEGSDYIELLNYFFDGLTLEKME